jgi:hypothetical protein
VSLHFGAQTRVRADEQLRVARLGGRLATEQRPEPRAQETDRDTGDQKYASSRRDRSSTPPPPGWLTDRVPGFGPKPPMT